MREMNEYKILTPKGIRTHIALADKFFYYQKKNSNLMQHANLVLVSKKAHFLPKKKTKFDSFEKRIILPLHPI